MNKPRLPTLKDLRDLTKNATDATILHEILKACRTAAKLSDTIPGLVWRHGFYRHRNHMAKFEQAIERTVKGPRYRMVLEVADVILDTCGVESIHQPQDDWPSLRDGPEHCIEYCNTGDSYALTLMWIKINGKAKWKVSTWGDEVEKAERRGVRFGN